MYRHRSLDTFARLTRDKTSDVIRRLFPIFLRIHDLKYKASYGSDFAVGCFHRSAYVRVGGIAFVTRESRDSWPATRLAYSVHSHPSLSSRSDKTLVAARC